MADDIDDTQDGGGSTQTPAPPDVGGGTVAPPGPVGNMFTGAAGVVQSPDGPQRPSYFKNIIKGLGLVLSQGALAGVQAPQNPQGPAIAAATAANMPQARFEQGMRNKALATSEKLDNMNVAITQLKLHQLQLMVSNMEEDQQNKVYNTGRDTMEKLLEKGEVEVLATGDYNSVTSEFSRRQMDANKAGQGLQPLQILPAAGSTAKDPKYALVQVGKGRLSESWDETDTPESLGYDKDVIKGAGLAPFKFHAPAGMDQQKALQMRVTQYGKWVSDTERAAGTYNKNQANIAARASEGKLNRNFKYSIEQMRQAGANARQAGKIAADAGNRELEKANKDVETATENYAKILKDPKFLGILSGGQGRSVKAAERAVDDATKYRDDLTRKLGQGAAAPAKRQVGDKVQLKDGRTVTITSINKDGSYGYK